MCARPTCRVAYFLVDETLHLSAAAVGCLTRIVLAAHFASQGSNRQSARVLGNHSLEVFECFHAGFRMMIRT